MTTTDYTDFTEATAALHAAMAEGVNDVALKTYQRPDDLAWVWAVSVAPTQAD
jgi:ABC-type iron transport system FetAB ATPase subunit